MPLLFCAAPGTREGSGRAAGMWAGFCWCHAIAAEAEERARHLATLHWGGRRWVGVAGVALTAFVGN